MSLSPIRAPCEWPPDLHPSSYAPLPYLTEAGSVNMKACDFSTSLPLRRALSERLTLPYLSLQYCNCRRFKIFKQRLSYSKYPLVVTSSLAEQLGETSSSTLF